MAELRIVLPNLVRFEQRGGLEERGATAKRLGLQAVEVPADLIKGVREAESTGRPIGDIPSREDVPRLYRRGGDVGFILHTDPGIPRRGRAGLVVPELRWDDRGWTAAYALFLARVARYLGGRALAVELHSGTNVLDVRTVAQAVGEVSDILASELGHRPAVVVENKVRQLVSGGEEMSALWDALGRDRRFGLVVDLPNLWKARRKRWLDDLRAIPPDALWGFHMHWKHRAPGPDDPIDWDEAMELVRRLPGPRFINPEVFHLSQLEVALRALGLRAGPGRPLT